jgi:hypothetical protein
MADYRLHTCALQNVISPSTVIAITKSGSKDRINACRRSLAFVLVISSTNAFFRALDVHADLRLATRLAVRLSSFRRASANSIAIG